MPGPSTAPQKSATKKERRPFAAKTVGATAKFGEPAKARPPPSVAPVKSATKEEKPDTKQEQTEPEVNQDQAELGDAPARKKVKMEETEQERMADLTRRYVAQPVPSSPGGTPVPISSSGTHVPSSSGGKAVPKLRGSILQEPEANILELARPVNILPVWD